MKELFRRAPKAFTPGEQTREQDTQTICGSSALHVGI